MKCNKGVVLISPITRTENIFDTDTLSNYRGTVVHVADDVEFCKVGDEVIFWTITPFIEEEKWYAVTEAEILVNLGGKG